MACARLRRGKQPSFQAPRLPMFFSELSLILIRWQPVPCQLTQLHCHAALHASNVLVTLAASMAIAPNFSAATCDGDLKLLLLGLGSVYYRIRGNQVADCTEGVVVTSDTRVTRV